MRIDLEFVELHSSLFLDGINFGTKLYADPKRSKWPVEIYYDTELEHTIVIYKDKLAMVESTASKTVKDPKLIKLASQKVLIKEAELKVEAVMPWTGSAQVSTPQSTVQGKPGRKAKYQGEEAPEG